MNKDSAIYISGHSGMLGSAISQKCKELGYSNILYRSHNELDLTIQKDVEEYFRNAKPEIVILAAAKVGGINANNVFRADFIYENLSIANNVIRSAYEFGIKKCIFFGASCIYPRKCQQPLKEEYILHGEFEPTNEPFAVAKIAGIKLCESYFKQYGCNFFSLIPCNMYGPNDMYDLETCHVLSALIRRFYVAKKKKNKSVTLWGTGTTLREFLYVDDMAEACIHFMENVNAADIYNQGISHLNVGTGKEISIMDLANIITKVVGYDGVIEFDRNKPDGIPRKLLDSSRANKIGWKAKTSIEQGIDLTYNSLLNNRQRFDWL